MHHHQQCHDDLVIVPSHRGHLKQCAALLGSLQQHSAASNVSFRVVVGPSLIEEAAFNARLAAYVSSLDDLRVVRFDLILSHFNATYPAIYDGAVQDTRGQHGAPPESNKYLYQFAKKLFAARFFLYKRALVIDSDSRFLPGDAAFRGGSSGARWALAPLLFGRAANAQHGAKFGRVDASGAINEASRSRGGARLVFFDEGLEERDTYASCLRLLGALDPYAGVMLTGQAAADPEALGSSSHVVATNHAHDQMGGSWPASATNRNSMAGLVSDANASLDAESSKWTRPALAPWGYAAWLWQRPFVRRLFDYIETRHRTPFLEVRCLTVCPRAAGACCSLQHVPRC